MRAKAEDGTHTLMKGDEGVELAEEGADRILFSKFWNLNSLIKQLRFGDAFDRRSLYYMNLGLKPAI